MSISSNEYLTTDSNVETGEKLTREDLIKRYAEI